MSGEKNEALVQKEARERGLREELKRKDEELRSLKKKQDELNRLSQMQNRYSSQLTKLETDITSMKKQRVDLTKTLNSEKKNHLSVFCTCKFVENMLNETKTVSFRVTVY